MTDDVLQPIDPVVEFTINDVKYESTVLTLEVQSKIEQATRQGYYDLLARTAKSNIPCGGFLIEEIKAIFKIAFPDVTEKQFNEFFIKERLVVYSAVFDVICLPFQVLIDDKDKGNEVKKNTQ